LLFSKFARLLKKQGRFAFSPVGLKEAPGFALRPLIPAGFVLVSTSGEVALGPASAPSRLIIEAPGLHYALLGFSIFGA
jgi:hypothetical protein